MAFVIILLILMVCYYFYYECTSLEVNKYHIKGKKKLKICHISDFHSCKNEKVIRSIINVIENEKPDFIALSGDTFEDSKTKNIKRGISFLKIISKYCPIYLVWGNHEMAKDNYKKIESHLKDLNIHVLNNKLEDLNGINIIGVQDPINHPNSEENTLKKEIESNFYDKKRYTILLSHRPEKFKLYKEEKFDLVLTGHAHGGMIRLPLIKGLYAPHQGLFPKYTSGLYKDGKTHMIVSRGCGASTVPYRVNNRIEIGIIEIEN